MRIKTHDAAVYRSEEYQQQCRVVLIVALLSIFLQRIITLLSLSISVSNSEKICGRLQHGIIYTNSIFFYSQFQPICMVYNRFLS